MMRTLIFFCLLLLSCNAGQKERGENTDPDPRHGEKEVVVLVYHRFGNDKYPSTNIGLDEFENHLKYLKDNKFNVMNFGQAVEYVLSNEIPYAEKVVCLTVDDGYKTFIENGLPLLQKYGYSATVFINSKSVGGGSYMSWEQLKQVQEQGVEIGNHSHSHAYFLNIAKEQRIKAFKEDVNICQQRIEENLGFIPKYFAYPYGEFDPDMKKALKELGFEAGLAQNSGVMYANDMYAIPRFPMAGPYVKMEGFKEKVNMHALRIKNEQPKSFVLAGSNPPELRISLVSENADLSRVNCFISNGCEIKTEGLELIVKANQPLRQRRTLYTITAPSSSGDGWYWYSHLWIQPKIPE
jgi:peptidoglycan/xylan/chitin deacetylase (PgdA/CDA1 family)